MCKGWGACLSDPLILAVRKESLLQLPTFPQHVHQQPRQSGEDTPIFKAGDSPMGAADANAISGFCCFARSLSLFVKENHFWTCLPWVLSLSFEELTPERLSKFSSQPSPPTRSLCLKERPSDRPYSASVCSWCADRWPHFPWLRPVAHRERVSSTEAGLCLAWSLLRLQLKTSAWHRVVSNQRIQFNRHGCES